MSRYYRREKKMMRITWLRMATKLQVWKMTMIMRRATKVRKNMIQYCKLYLKKTVYPRNKRNNLSEVKKIAAMVKAGNVTTNARLKKY